jgi:hypothetical protein
MIYYESETPAEPEESRESDFDACPAEKKATIEEIKMFNQGKGDV